MSDNLRTEHERGVQKRIIAFLREMSAASDYMFRCAESEDGKGIRNTKLYDRAIILVEMQSDIVDYLIEFSGESNESILFQVEMGADSENDKMKEKLQKPSL